MRRILLTPMLQTAGRIAAGLLVVAGLLAGVGTQRAAAETPNLCAAGRPCITEISVTSTGNLTARWSGNWDAYNIRWERFSGPGSDLLLISAVDVGGAHLSTLNVPRGYEFDTYRFSVQGCNRRVLASSECSLWSKREIVPALPHGSDTCRPGFVWREAYEGDKTCVPSRSRDQAVSDNAQAADRREPGGNSCKPGFVWREARDGDTVCVTPAVRTQTFSENYLANGRRADPIVSSQTPRDIPLHQVSFLRASNVPGQFIRHRNTLGEISRVSLDGPDLDIADATWVMRPALNGTPGAVSFESANYPGTFLRHQAFRIKQHRNDNSDLFKDDASFIVRPGLNGGDTKSFEAVNAPSPGYFIRHQNFELWIAKGDGSQLFKDDASFVRQQLP